MTGPVFTNILRLHLRFSTPDADLKFYRNVKVSGNVPKSNWEACRLEDVQQFLARIIIFSTSYNAL